MHDVRVDPLSALFRPKKTTYAQVAFLDPAPPQVKPDDPSTRFPLELRQVDGLIEVIRNFDAGLGAPAPRADHRTFAEELVLNDLISVERRLERIAQERKRGREVDQEEIRLLEEAKAHLESERPLRELPEVAGHVKLKGFGLLSAKPLLVVANNPEGDPAPPDLGEAEPPLVVRAAIEAELAELDPGEQAVFLADLGLAENTLDRLIAASYRALDAVSFFTVGEDEVRAWTVRRGALAPQAAGVSTRSGEGFIRAEVKRYEDLLARLRAAVKKAASSALRRIPLRTATLHGASTSDGSTRFAG